MVRRRLLFWGVSPELGLMLGMAGGGGTAYAQTSTTITGSVVLYHLTFNADDLTVRATTENTGATVERSRPIALVK